MYFPTDGTPTTLNRPLDRELTTPRPLPPVYSTMPMAPDMAAVEERLKKQH